LFNVEVQGPGKWKIVILIIKKNRCHFYCSSPSSGDRLNKNNTINVIDGNSNSDNNSCGVSYKNSNNIYCSNDNSYDNV
jgi:hypothetical protein